jgi:AraC-like DNA-binding protein
MRLGQDIAIRFPGLYLVHHNIPGMKVDWHDWPQHLLFIPLQGEIRILLRSGSLVGGPGKMLYFPPKTSLNFRASETLGERLVCLIDHTHWPAGTSFQSGPAMCPAPQLCKEHLFYLLLNPKTKSAESLVSAFIQLLAESIESTQQTSLLEVTHLEAKVRDERVRKALSILLRDHRTRVRMAAVAQEAGLSLRNLSRLFLDQVGLSPKQVLTQYRIAAARDLLLTGSTVTEAASGTGYESLAQFTTTFRRLTGQLPSQVVHLGRKQ